MSHTVPYDLEIRRGARYDVTVFWRDAADVPRSLAGRQARMHIREDVDSPTIALELTSENGFIVLEPNAEVGRIDIRIGATHTAALTIPAGVYDLEVYDPLNPDNVEILMAGRVRLQGNVTR